MHIIQKVITALVLIAVSATTTFAEPLPSGCYVTDEERSVYSGSYSCDNCDPPACHTASDGSYSFFTPGNTSTNDLIGMYGDVAYALINSGYQSDVQSEVNYEAYLAQLKLVRKLRKACGFRCKRIK
jgi:hypothetical protein